MKYCRRYDIIVVGDDIMTDILIVEDDKELAGLMTDFLRTEGYIVSAVESGERAVELFDRYGARLVVLDINLPDVNGFAVCSKLRENTDTPILIVSARTDKEDKLNGLDLGADDYIEKPYDIDILLAKIKGIFKRRYQRQILSASGVTLNLAGKSAEIDGKPVELTAKEFDLLTLLIENQGKALKKEYPDAICSLTARTPLQLLIATRLSAQCTDARVNLVTPALFESYPTLDAFCEADREDVEELIHSCGFYHGKARDIIGMCRMIRSDFGGEVPDNIDDLVKLPGVGRKTANLIVGDVYKKPAVVTDTHLIRISNRIGLVNTKDPKRSNLN